MTMVVLLITMIAVQENIWMEYLTQKVSSLLHMTGHRLALVLVGEALVGVAHVLGGVLQGERLLPR